MSVPVGTRIRRHYRRTTQTGERDGAITVGARIPPPIFVTFAKIAEKRNMPFSTLAAEMIRDHLATMAEVPPDGGLDRAKDEIAVLAVGIESAEKRLAVLDKRLGVET